MRFSEVTDYGKRTDISTRGHSEEQVNELVMKFKYECSEFLDEAKKEVFAEIGNFEFKEPYDYSQSELQFKYEEAAKKLFAVIVKLQKWFGEATEK